MNKIIVKGHEIPLKSGIHVIDNEIVVRLKVLDKGSKILTNIVENFIFNQKPAPNIEEIAVHKNSCFILGSNKFVYRLTFDQTPIFKKIDFAKKIEIPKTFNKKLSKMYNVKNFDNEREKLFTVEKYKPASYSESVCSFNLNGIIRETFRGEYKTRIN